MERTTSETDTDCSVGEEKHQSWNDSGDETSGLVIYKLIGPLLQEAFEGPLLQEAFEGPLQQLGTTTRIHIWSQKWVIKWRKKRKKSEWL